MHLVLASNPKRPETEGVRERVAFMAKKAGFTYSIFDGSEASVPKNSDLFVVLGGDGSFLRVAHIAARLNIPLIGVHCGRVGFLTELTEEDVPEILERIKACDYDICERAMLDVRVDGGEPFTCLNDVLVFKNSFSGVSQLGISVDRCSAGTVFGDGIVVATPTGATGYSLSAGGPIVEPEAHNILITPICAHDVMSRCMVASEKRVITVGLTMNARRNAFLSVDGGKALRLNMGDVATIKKSDLLTRLVRLKDRSFYDVVNVKFRNGR